MNDSDLLYFPLQKGEDWMEKYEEMLFEDKQFFVSKSVIPPVFRARIEKMKKREGAFRRLTNLRKSNVTWEWSETFSGSPDLLENYNLYQANRSKILRDLFLATEIDQVIAIIERLLERYKVFSSHWKLEHLSDVEGVLLAKDPDPSELFSAIQNFHQAGGKNVNQIQTLFFDKKIILLNEAKRLSLQLQKGW